MPTKHNLPELSKVSPNLTQYGDAALAHKQRLIQAEINEAMEYGDQELLARKNDEMGQIQGERLRRNLDRPATDTRRADAQTAMVSQCITDFREYQKGCLGGISNIPTPVVQGEPSPGVQGEEDTEGAWQRQRYGELDLNTFVRLAIEADRWSQRENGTVPAFHLARYCKSYPPFALLSGAEVFESIYHLMSEYDGEAQANFVFYFDVARHAPGEHILDTALRLAKARLLRETVHTLYDLFVSMAGYLQKNEGERNIFLPQKDVAQKLGVSQATVSNLTARAVNDGYLVPSRKAIPDLRAAEFRFNLDKFPMLKEGQ
jgi:hypothetical protein